jgi:hypothetical protein
VADGLAVGLLVAYTAGQSCASTRHTALTAVQRCSSSTRSRRCCTGSPLRHTTTSCAPVRPCAPCSPADATTRRRCSRPTSTGCCSASSSSTTSRSGSTSPRSRSSSPVSSSTSGLRRVRVLRVCALRRSLMRVQRRSRVCWTRSRPRMCKRCAGTVAPRRRRRKHERGDGIGRRKPERGAGIGRRMGYAVHVVV